MKKVPDIVKYLLFLVVVAFLSSLCPNQIQFKYQYNVGARWKYEDLYAPFDFAIKKAPETIEQEKKEIESEFSPYYEVRPPVARAQKRKYLENFDEQLDQAQEDRQFSDVLQQPERYRRFGLQFIDRTFKKGIISLSPEHQNKGKDFVINVLDGNVAQKKTLQSIPTVPKVNSQIADTLFNSGLREAEFLIPLLDEVFVPNLYYNDTLTQKFKEAAFSNLSVSRGAVQKGELVVQNGEVITENTYQKLLSFEDQYKKEVTIRRSYWGVILGYLILTGIVMGGYLLYLLYNEREIFKRFNRLVFMLMWFVVYGYLVYLMEQSSALSAWLVPFCIAPIVIKNFFSDRLALFTHVVIVLIASFLTSLGYEFTTLNILAGIVAVLIRTETRYWSHFFQSILLILLTYAIGYFGLSLIQDGSISEVNPMIYAFLFFNVLFTLLAYPLIPLLEKVFGFTSSITLAELSDLNRPLLKELSLKAPGTFQHSLQVANLGEAAARRIEADSLLVKVAALYHDIGKVKNPPYFIENQSGTNPHAEITYLESAQVIIGHVEEGVRMARKQRLPNVIIDFIRTHHGDTRVEYFYRNYLKENPGAEFEEDLFRYPGPKPRTKEQTVLMMADSLEAASKSLKDPSGKDIDELVEKIIAGKISTGQFEESNLTFEELEQCAEEFKKLLRSINHVRVEYPEEVKK